MTDRLTDTDWTARAYELTPWAFVSLPGWQALMAGFAVAVQDLDTDGLALYRVTLDTASGNALEQYGETAQVQRGGMTDGALRRAIRGAGYAVASSGTEPDVLKWASVFWSSTDIEVTLYDVPEFRMSVTAEPGSGAYNFQARRQLDIAKAAGVGATMVRVPTSGAFRFNSGPGFNVGVLSEEI